MILNGTYIFNDSIDLAPMSNYTDSTPYVVNFTSNGIKHNSIAVFIDLIDNNYSSLYYSILVEEPTGFIPQLVNVYSVGLGWTNEAYRTVTFENQEVSDEFYTWFTKNATAIDEVYTIKKSTLKGIADSIREKKGTSENILVGEFANEIKDIETYEDTPKALIDRSIKSIDIPEGTKIIGAHSFNACSLLESVTIPNGVTTLSFSCFYGCSSLKEIILPDSVTNLEQTAFAAARSLERAYLGSGMRTIWANVFQNCYALMEIICLAETPPTIQANSFSGVPEDCVIYVPEGSVDAYKSATNWSDRADYIVGVRFIHGTYRFNDGINAEGSVIEQDVNFISNGTAFTHMTFNPAMMELYYGSESVYVGYGNGWSNIAYKTVTFEGGIASEEFYAFVESNAVEVTE